LPRAYESQVKSWVVTLNYLAEGKLKLNVIGQQGVERRGERQ
jgi:hypothetical protein